MCKEVVWGGVRSSVSCQPRMLDYEMTHGERASSDYRLHSTGRWERLKELVRTFGQSSSNVLTKSCWYDKRAPVTCPMKKGDLDLLIGMCTATAASWDSRAPLQNPTVRVVHALFQHDPGILFVSLARFRRCEKQGRITLFTKNHFSGLKAPLT